MDENSKISNIHKNLLTSFNKESKNVCRSINSSLNILSLSTNNILNTKPRLKSFLEIKKYIFRKLTNIYKIDSNFYNIKQIDQILSNEDTHLVSLYKDLLLFNDEHEFLKHYYNYYVGRFYLIDLFQYYNEYSILFPNYIILPERKYIYKNIKKKQKLIDLQQQLNESTEEKIDEKNNTNNGTFFTSSALNSILNKTNTSNIKKIFGIQTNENKDKNNDTLHNILDKLTKSERKNFNNDVNLSHRRNNNKSLINVNNNKNVSKKNKKKLNKLLLLKNLNITDLVMNGTMTDRYSKKICFRNNTNKCLAHNFYNKPKLKINNLMSEKIADKIEGKDQKRKIQSLNIINSAKQIQNPKYVLNLKDFNQSYKVLPNRIKKKINTYTCDNYYTQNNKYIGIKKQQLINGIILKNQINSKILDKNINTTYFDLKNSQLNIIKPNSKRKIKSNLNINKIRRKKSTKSIKPNSKMRIIKIKNLSNFNENISPKSPDSIVLKNKGNFRFCNLKNYYSSHARHRIFKTSKKFPHCPTSFNNLTNNKNSNNSITEKKKKYNFDKYNKFQSHKFNLNKNDISIYIHISNDSNILNNNDENNKKLSFKKIKPNLLKRQLSFINSNINNYYDKKKLFINSDRKIKPKQIVKKQGLKEKRNLNQCPTSRENYHSNKIMKDIHKFEVKYRRVPIQEKTIKEKSRKCELINWYKIKNKSISIKNNKSKDSKKINHLKDC